jgi:hypothetical protein
MRIDREMYRDRFAAQAEQAAQANADLRAAVEAEDWSAAEALLQRLLFDKPEEFWNLPKLRELYRTDRTPSFREILEVAFGLRREIESRAQLARGHFERFVCAQPVDATKLRELRQVFHACVLDPVQRAQIETGNFATLRASDPALFRAIQQLGGQAVESLRTYIRTELPVPDSEHEVA